MRRLLQLGFVLGLAGTLASAWLYPWFDYTRYRSATGVVTNGGRVEQFIVRLPADQIDAGARSEIHPDADLKHYKLRDVEGNVIGVAARHVLGIDGMDQTAWVLTIPSRGSVALAADSVDTGAIESLVAASGVLPGQTLEQPLSIDSGLAAQSVTATGEFANIDLELFETWVVTGIDDEGRIRGTLRLNTVGRQAT